VSLLVKGVTAGVVAAVWGEGEEVVAEAAVVAGLLEEVEVIVKRPHNKYRTYL
jgi:hypothetical protein